MPLRIRRYFPDPDDPIFQAAFTVVSPWRGKRSTIATEEGRKQNVKTARAALAEETQDQESHHGIQELLGPNWGERL